MQHVLGRQQRSRRTPILINSLKPELRRQWFNSLSFDQGIGLGLIVSILAVYAQVRQFDFINFDDDLYVYRNGAVKAGLTFDSIRLAFTSAFVGHWVPITMLSHVLAWQFFHADAGLHHLANVLFHLLASILLFGVLTRSTGARWPSAFVAFIFALHPLHVDSVAWISERKDVLSGCFWFLALYAYVRYAERPGWRRYLLVALPFCLGLMSKAMLVTFPLTLLLFDVWPLRRSQWPKTLWEKLPLFALSAADALINYLTHRSAGIVTEDVPLAMRIGNSLISYVTYIKETFWPAGLAIFYPYPASIPAWQVVCAFTLLAAVSVLAIFTWRTRSYLATGWFWYLATPVPVIGLVKVGAYSHADHFTYVPMIGLLIMLAWGAAESIEKWPRMRPAIAAAAVVCCVLCAVLAWQQTGYWQNSETVYRHAIDVTDDNWLAESNLGAHLMNFPDRRPEAVEHMETALRIFPGHPETENNLGLCLARLELCSAAIPHFEAALKAKPEMVQARNNLAMCLTRNGNYGAAIDQLETALRIQPDFANAHFSLGLTLAKIAGREREAIDQYETGLRLNPDKSGRDQADAHRDVGKILLTIGRPEEAMVHFEAARKIRPDAEILTIIDQLRAQFPKT